MTWTTAWVFLVRLATTEGLPFAFGLLLGSTIAPPSVRLYLRYRIKPAVNKAYLSLRRVVETHTLNPDAPGRQEYMRVVARDEANGIRRRLQRCGFATPRHAQTTMHPYNCGLAH